MEDAQVVVYLKLAVEELATAVRELTEELRVARVSAE